MINWSFKIIPMDQLVSYFKNPRVLSQKEHADLEESLNKFGLMATPVINEDFTIIGGHQRIEILRSQGALEVECRVPDRLLTDKELEEACIRLNKNTGSWDYDALANQFELPDLFAYGFTEMDLGLGKDEKPKKEKKPKVTLEFDNAELLMAHLPAMEEVQQKTGAKMQVRA